jgi:hypothetical protein
VTTRLTHFTGNPIAANDSTLTITQEEELDSSTLDVIAHQLSRVAEDSLEDEQFDSVVDHEWSKGILTFRIRLKTDEISSIPYDRAKQDYPAEIARYIIDNKVGSPGGYHTGGKYTRWARHYERQYRPYRFDDYSV